MNSLCKSNRGILAVAILGWLAAWIQISSAQPVAGSPQITNEVRIVELQGTAEIISASATTWQPAQTGQILHPFDRLRTSANSRIAIRWSDQSVIAFGASTELEILPPPSPGDQCGLHLLRGIFSFFHRDQPGRIQIITRGAVAGVEGTEFVMTVDDADATSLAVIDGKIRFGNEQATLVLTNGQQAVAELGGAPVRTAGFIANNL
ncbi:MAG TPA: FecR family protein, partial [Candidatus Saccharimonadales bacterium]|nr:FecR family protein [Candidatus Saccharimonadales bacterium]